MYAATDANCMASFDLIHYLYLYMPLLTSYHDLATIRWIGCVIKYFNLYLR